MSDVLAHNDPAQDVHAYPRRLNASTQTLTRPTALPAPRLPAFPAPRTQHGNVSSVVMLLPVRIFLAAGWLRAAAEKIIDRNWWNGTTLEGFLVKQHQEALPFFRPVMDHAIAPAAAPIAFIVMITQLLCGLAIATGVKMRLALRWACLLNVTFILAGRVNPSAFYLVMELVLLFAIADGTIGARPSIPSRRSFIAAGVSAAAAVAFIPYIRTIEPAKVIEDPAMMMTFLGMTVAVTLLIRRAAHPDFQLTRLGLLWHHWLAGWLHVAPHSRFRLDK